VRRKAFRPALAAAILAAAGGFLALVLPPLVVSGSALRNLDILRKKARVIQRSYASLARTQEQTLDRLTRTSFPRAAADQFALFKSIGLDPETEGVALYDSERRLRIWLGRAVNLEPLFSGSPPSLTPSFRPKQILVRDRASSVLTLIVRLETGEVLAVHRLLAFIPGFPSPYLEEYGFLPVRVRRSAAIDYWDFREDLSSFERLFRGHQDEFISTPRSDGETPSLLFPLRTAEGRIIATAGLRSPAPAARRLALRETLFFSALAALAAALLLFVAAGFLSPAYFPKSRLQSAAVFLLALFGFRAVFIPLGRLGPAAASPLFSPGQAGFVSWGNLAGSPFDIFLTALTLFGLAAGLTRLLGRRTEPGRKASPATAVAGLLSLPFLFAGVLLIIERIAIHSNVHLLRFFSERSVSSPPRGDFSPGGGGRRPGGGRPEKTFRPTARAGLDRRGVRPSVRLASLDSPPFGSGAGPSLRVRPGPGPGRILSRPAALEKNRGDPRSPRRLGWNLRHDPPSGLGQVALPGRGIPPPNSRNPRLLGPLPAG
jgi:hypothetical protein